MKKHNPKNNKQYNNILGQKNYVNSKCWLVSNLGYKVLPRCRYCDIKWRDCSLIHFFVTSVSLFSILFISLFIFDFEIKKFFTFVFISAFVILGYLSNKGTDKLIKQRYEVWKSNKDLIKMNEKLKQLDEMKSEFITIIAHQLRTPLSGIKWIFNSLANGDFGKISKDQKNIINRGYTANERILKVIDNLLRVKNIETGIKMYFFEKGSVERIARRVIRDFSLMAEQKKIDLRFTEGDIIPDIMIDSVRINIVLSILVENAFNYTPEGGKIEVALENLGGRVRVSVKDNGIGISKDEKERLFTYFFRGKEAVKMQTEGTGLGLYIAKGIVAVHGGEIGFKSKEDKGTTFWFTLPL